MFCHLLTSQLCLYACHFIILFKVFIGNDTDNSFATKGTGCGCINRYFYVYIQSFSYNNEFVDLSNLSTLFTITQ